MKTLFNALRAAIFGAGFISLWGWVALGVHRSYDDTLGFATVSQCNEVTLVQACDSRDAC